MPCAPDALAENDEPPPLAPSMPLPPWLAGGGASASAAAAAPTEVGRRSPSVSEPFCASQMSQMVACVPISATGSGAVCTSFCFVSSLKVCAELDVNMSAMSPRALSSASYAAFCALTIGAAGESIATHVPASSSSQKVSVSRSSITTGSSSCASLSLTTTGSSCASGASLASKASPCSATTVSSSIFSLVLPSKLSPPPSTLPMELFSPTPFLLVSRLEDCSVEPPVSSIAGLNGWSCAEEPSKLLGVTSLPISSRTITSGAACSPPGTPFALPAMLILVDGPTFEPFITLCPGARLTRDCGGARDLLEAAIEEPPNEELMVACASAHARATTEAGTHCSGRRAVAALRLSA